VGETIDDKNVKTQYELNGWRFGSPDSNEIQVVG